MEVDNVLLYDNNIEGNFYHTFDYLKLCGDNGITFNKKKFQFCQMEVEFAGFRVTADEVKPSNSILDNIKNFPKPMTLNKARHWLGLIEQVAWSYSIGDTMTNFRDQVKQTIKTWSWTPMLQEEFKHEKEEIVRRVKNGVKTYNISKKTCLLTDWSKLGIGFLVSQKIVIVPWRRRQDAARMAGRSSSLGVRSAQVWSPGTPPSRGRHSGWPGR